MEESNTMTPDAEEYASQRLAKQDYLKEQIQDKGYDTVEFATYLMD